jgi:hypothetical protein
VERSQQERKAKQIPDVTIPASRRGRRTSRAVENDHLRNRLALFICAWLTIDATAALTLFFLQGFRTGGFHLELELMHWIGTATVGCIATLAGMVYRCFFTPR